MSQCFLCGRQLNVPLSLTFLMNFKAYRQPVICKECRQKFERIPEEHCCRDCSKAGDFKDSICPDCRRWRRVTGERFQNYSLYQYNFMMSEYMHRYKFNGDYRLRSVFSGQFSCFVKGMARRVVVIPIHQATRRQRGFNQVTGLLDSLPIVDVLKTKKNRKTVPQSHKSRMDRLRLVQPFLLKAGCRELIQGRRLAVIDDVYTTGTTMHHAVKLLKQTGAKSVIGVTLAR